MELLRQYERPFIVPCRVYVPVCDDRNDETCTVPQSEGGEHAHKGTIRSHKGTIRFNVSMSPQYSHKNNLSQPRA